MKTKTVYVGVDRRQWVAFTVLQYSIHHRAREPVHVVPLLIEQLPIKRSGLTDFTFSRFLVPWLCDFKGPAVFVDADFLCLTDINEIFSHFDSQYAVQVVKSKFKFEWPSLMLFNCDKCQDLTPEFINHETSQPQNLDWGEVGTIPSEWNFLVGYDHPRITPKMVHYTQGIPAFLEMEGTPFYEEWHQDFRAATKTCSWHELMGQSVHAPHVVKRIEIQRQLRRSALEKQRQQRVHLTHD